MISVSGAREKNKNKILPKKSLVTSWKVQLGIETRLTKNFFFFLENKKYKNL